MLKTIEQSVYFRATPAELFKIFIDPKKHAAVTGAPVTLIARPGGKFTAFGGMLTGTMLAIVPDKLIVQRWRSMMFKKSDLDSTLILTFNPQGRGCRVDLVHVNVPKHDHTGVVLGWPKYYWGPMREYLAKRKRSRELDRSLIGAMKSGPAAPMTAADWQRIRAAVNQRLARKCKAGK